MDNIQKLIVGVLGVSGLLAMLTPSTVPVIDGSSLAAPSSEASPPPPAYIESGESPVDELAEEATSEDSEDFTLGEPSIDGNPIGVTEQPQYQPNEGSSSEYAQPFDYSSGNFVPQAAAPQNNAPPPAVVQAPVNMGN